MSIILDGSSGIVVSGNTNTLSGITVSRGAGSVATNTAVGASALAANTTGADNTALGYGALKTNTTSNYSTAIGRDALTLATGARNTAIGAYSQNTVSTGTSNTSIGVGALNLTTTGSYNTAVGDAALLSNTTASYNTAVGYQAGYSNSTNTGNTFVGYTAGYSTTGSYNTFIGPGSGYSVTSGTKNTIIGGYNGNQSGLNISTLSNYIVLSDGDGNPRGVFDSAGAFCVNAAGPVIAGYITNTYNGASYRGLVLNDSSSTSSGTFAGFAIAGTQIGSITRVASTSAVAYNTTSDQRLKSNIEDAAPVLDKLMAVKVRQYDWTEGDLHQDYGFIAQELEPALSGVVTKGKEDEDMWQLDYSRLTPHLVKAIQELNTKLDAQAAEIAALKGQA